MFRVSLLVLLLIGVAGAATTPALRAEESADLTGVYVCDGVNPEGHPYRGIVEIIKTEETFHLRWTFPQNNDAALGIGIVSNGVLAVSYYGGAATGVVVYKIDTGKRMVGEWTVTGAGGGVYKETLTRLPSSPGMPPPGMPDDREHRRVPDDGDHRPAERQHKPETPVGDRSRLIQG